MINRLFSSKNLSYLIPIAAIVFFLTLGRRVFAKGGLLSSTGVVGAVLGGQTPGEATHQENQKAVVETIDDTRLQLSHSETALNQIVESLDKAMRDWGTNEERIFELLTPLKKDDLIYVVKRFGVRKETFFLVTTFEGNLFTWLEAELDQEDLKKVGELFRPTGLWPFTF